VSAKPVIPRELANQDVEAAVDHYLREGGKKTARGFIDGLEHAYRQLASYPGAGSPRYAQDLDLPGLRCWPLKRYPYLIFYAERDDHIDVWRVLHGERDIPASMRPPENS
jgi:toxin ParE1/3/4